MPIHIPGTRALKVLEAAGRRLSFTRAAEDLGLTPAAVSHQIKEFEEQLGFALFARTSRTMQLTEPGRSSMNQRSTLWQTSSARSCAPAS